MNTTQQLDIRKLVEKEMRPFSPAAYYDEEMDFIRVQLRDCSVCEKRVNDWITLLRDNHPKEGQHRCMGLTITEVNHLFDTTELPKNTILTVVHILNIILEKTQSETPVDKAVIKELQPCIDVLLETGISVRVPA